MKKISNIAQKLGSDFVDVFASEITPEYIGLSIGSGIYDIVDAIPFALESAYNYFDLVDLSFPEYEVRHVETKVDFHDVVMESYDNYSVPCSVVYNVRLKFVDGSTINFDTDFIAIPDRVEADVKGVYSEGGFGQPPEFEMTGVEVEGFEWDASTYFNILIF